MRLIDMDAFEVDALKSVSLEFDAGVIYALEMLDKAPTVEDAVVVTRCNGCRYGKPIDTTQPPFRYYRPECVICYCEEAIGDEPMVYPPTHFCGYGERKIDSAAD